MLTARHEELERLGKHKEVAAHIVYLCCGEYPAMGISRVGGEYVLAARLRRRPSEETIFPSQIGNIKLEVRVTGAVRPLGRDNSHGEEGGEG